MPMIELVVAMVVTSMALLYVPIITIYYALALSIRVLMDPTMTPLPVATSIHSYVVINFMTCVAIQERL